MGLVFGCDYILLLFGEFFECYFDIVFDWYFDNCQVDFIGEGFDVVIGGGFELLFGVVVCNLMLGYLIFFVLFIYFCDKLLICYLGDLGGFDGICICLLQIGCVCFWLLCWCNGEEVLIELCECMIMSDLEVICEVVVMGLGIILVCMQYVYVYLEFGVLVWVLLDWYVDVGNISFYYVVNKLLLVKIWVFVDFVVDYFCCQDLVWCFFVFLIGQCQLFVVLVNGKRFWYWFCWKNGSLILLIGILVLENVVDEFGRCFLYGFEGLFGSFVLIWYMECSMCEFFGVLLLFWFLLLKLGLFFLFWVLCVGLYVVGFGVWLVLVFGWFVSLVMFVFFLCVFW